MNLNSGTWAKVLERWSQLPSSGELKLVCAVLADGIVRRDKEPWFFSGDGFDNYCRVIGLDAQFVRQQIKRAAAYRKPDDDEMM